MVPSTISMRWLVMIDNLLEELKDSLLIQFVIHPPLARYLVHNSRYIIVDFIGCKISKVDWTSILLMQCVMWSYPCHMSVSIFLSNMSCNFIIIPKLIKKGKRNISVHVLMWMWAGSLHIDIGCPWCMIKCDMPSLCGHGYQYSSNVIYIESMKGLKIAVST